MPPIFVDILILFKKRGFIQICNHQYKYYWRNQYNFAYENEDFVELQLKPLHKKYNIKPCYLLNKNTGEKIKYNSKYSAHYYTDLKRGELENENFKIIVIN